MAAISQRNLQQLDSIVMEMNMVADQAKKAVAYDSFIREVAEEAGLDFPADEDLTPEQLELFKNHMKKLQEDKVKSDQAKKAVAYESFIREVAEDVELDFPAGEGLTSEQLGRLKNHVKKLHEDKVKFLGNKTVEENVKEKEDLRLQNEKLTKFMLDDIAKKTEFMKTVKIPIFALPGPAPPEENGDDAAAHNTSGDTTQANDVNDESNGIRKRRGSASKASSFALPGRNEGGALAGKSSGGVTQAKDSSDGSNGNKKRQRTTPNASSSRSHKNVSVALPGLNEGGARAEKSLGDATQADDAGDEGNSDKKRRRVSSHAKKPHSSTIVNLRNIAWVAPSADGTIAEKASVGVTPAIDASDEDKGNKKTRMSSPLNTFGAPTEAYDGGSSAGSTPTAITQEEGVKSETTGNKQRSSTRAIKPPKKFRGTLFDLEYE